MSYVGVAAGKFSPMSKKLPPIVVLPFYYHSISVLLSFYYDAYMMRLCFSYVRGRKGDFGMFFRDNFHGTNRQNRFFVPEYEFLAPKIGFLSLSGRRGHKLFCGTKIGCNFASGKLNQSHETDRNPDAPVRPGRLADEQTKEEADSIPHIARRKDKQLQQRGIQGDSSRTAVRNGT